MSEISLCIIGRDEQDNVRQCLESCIEIIDEVVFVDTGSRDSTKDIVRSLCGRHGKILKLIDSPWRDDFSYHRNESFNAATRDFILWLDCDDELINPDALKKFIDKNSDRIEIVSLPYDYATDDDGNVTVVHWRERVLRNRRHPEDPSRSFWVWKDRVHEYLYYPESTKIDLLQTCRVRHRKKIDGSLNDKKASNERNIRILEEIIREAGGLEKASARHLVYLGSEYWVRGRMDEARKVYNAYLKKTDWDEEAVQILCRLSEMDLKEGNIESAADNALMALKLCPSWPDPYLALARVEFEKKRFRNVINLCDIVLMLPEPQTVLVLTPLQKNYTPKVLKYMSLMELGRFEEALELVKECLKIRKNEQFLKEDYKKIQEELARRRTVESVVYLGPVLGLDVLKSLPEEVRAEPIIQDMIIAASGKSKSGKRKGSLAIYTGPFIEPWGPWSFESGGVGGSETAAWRVAELMAERGYDVTVFGEPGPGVGYHGSIMYAPARMFLELSDSYDSVLCSRRADLADAGIPARRKVLWLHDVNIGDSLTAERARKFDCFVFVSEWQAEQYRNLYEGVTAEKSIVIGNAISTSLLEKAFEEFSGDKDPYRFIYPSSPERGLDYLLDMWPYIKEIMPEATLDIYYGFKNIEFFLSQNPDLRAIYRKLLGKIEFLEKLGVKNHGRVSQLQLYKEMLGSTWWVYPTLFCETFCITALEAVACGLIPVVSNVGALPSTLKGHGFLIDGSPEYPEVRRAFLDTISNVVKDIKADSTSFVERASAAAREVPVDWSQRADLWEEVLFG